MDAYQSALMFAAVMMASLCICARNWRGMLWIGIGVLNFIITAYYEHLGYQQHPVFTAFADGVVCLSIFMIGKYKWELLLYLVYQGSVLVSILQFLGLTAGHYSYIVALEFCNYLALAVIGMWSSALMVGDGTSAPWSPRGVVYRFIYSLFSAEQKNR